MLVRWLLRHGASPSLRLRNRMGITPLDMAREFGPHREVEGVLGAAMLDKHFAENRLPDGPTIERHSSNDMVESMRLPQPTSSDESNASASASKPPDTAIPPMPFAAPQTPSRRDIRICERDGDWEGKALPLESMAARFDSLEARFEAMGSKVDAQFDAHADAIEARFMARFASLEQRIMSLRPLGPSEATRHTMPNAHVEQ